MKKLALLPALLIIGSVLLEVNAQTPEIDSLENLLHKHTQKDTIRINLLNKIAYKLYSANIDKTLKYAEKAGELADKQNFAKGKAKSLRLIGIYHSIKSYYPKALEYFQNSLKIKKEVGDISGTCLSYMDIGAVYLKTNNYTKVFA